MGCENNNEQKMLMNEIRQYAFSVKELSLYLDTHPCDQRALRAHNEYSEKLSKLKDIYQEKYGPLTIYYPAGNNWQWIEGPWPWEKGGI